MRTVILGVAVVVFAFVLGRLSAQDIQPSCEMCPSSYIAAEELQQYVEVGRAASVTDQQVRSIDAGRR